MVILTQTSSASPKKASRARSRRVFHTFCQAQFSSRAWLRDEHGLSNLCHRNAIYISVHCFCFLYEPIEPQFALNFVAHWSMNIFLFFFPRDCTFFFDVYALLIDRESSGFFSCETLELREKHLIDVCISWSNCIYKLTLRENWKLDFSCMGNLRNIFWMLIKSNKW